MPIGELITWRQLAGDPRLSGALTECDAREWMHWRYEQQIGWDGQKRAVRERNRRKHPPAVPMFRKRLYIPHQAAARNWGDEKFP